MRWSAGRTVTSTSSALVVPWRINEPLELSVMVGSPSSRRVVELAAADGRAVGGDVRREERDVEIALIDRPGNGGFGAEGVIGVPEDVVAGEAVELGAGGLIGVGEALSKLDQDDVAVSVE